MVLERSPSLPSPPLPLLGMLEMALACFSGRLKAAARSKLDMGPSWAKGEAEFEMELLLLIEELLKDEDPPLEGMFESN